MAFTSSLPSHFLPPLPLSTKSTTSPFLTLLSPQPLFFSFSSSSSFSFSLRASKNTSSNKTSSPKDNEFEEVEEELPWIQEKALDVVEFTTSVTQAIPGPRVGPTSLPWILAVPLGYVAVTFVISFVNTVKKFTSPKAKRRKLVGKNATLLKSLDDLFRQGRDKLNLDALKELENKTGFDSEGILRKYIRYALNEKPFNPDLVADLIQLRSATMLNDSSVAQILNEISQRVVRDKGPIVLDKSGYTEKGFKRKLAVQALFGKIFYLSEVSGCK
ncbi:hypothetical protein TanjilG_25103 [Lupinus angustifolius]|uniref:Armadillo-like repeats domain-containing protein n=1 Tax=Lupinus angustifolius TaxID=3871 RepID=A0A1J7HNE9_LUPAN|nr:hypothetical protein TanjilG_25103 [Lupinus angustifolius]